MKLISVTICHKNYPVFHLIKNIADMYMYFILICNFCNRHDENKKIEIL